MEQQISDEKFNKKKSEAENYYKNIREIYCPYFREKIVFNAKGWEHLKFKTYRHARTRNDQYIRFKLLHLVPEIIKNSHTVQGIWTTKKLEFMNINSRWENIMKNVTFWEFIAVIEEVRVRIIIKQIEEGVKYFWSIIPFWKIDTGTKRRFLYSGKPDID